jgi:hypothetical protein
MTPHEARLAERSRIEEALYASLEQAKAERKPGTLEDLYLQGRIDGILAAIGAFTRLP